MAEDRPKITIEEKIDAILDEYKSHPSIVMINHKVRVTTKFEFKKTTAEKMFKQIMALDNKKSNT